MPRPFMELFKKRSGIANYRMSRHARQRLPSPSTIWKWEHQMIRWMEAYRGGHNTKEAQLLVKWFSSHRYTSHCVSTEAMGHILD